MRLKLLGAVVTLTTTPTIISISAVDILVVHDAGGNTMRVITVHENDGTTVVGSYYSNPAHELVLRIKSGQKLSVDTGTDVHVSPVSWLS